MQRFSVECGGHSTGETKIISHNGLIRESTHWATGRHTHQEEKSNKSPIETFCFLSFVFSVEANQSTDRFYI